MKTEFPHSNPPWRTARRLLVPTDATISSALTAVPPSLVISNICAAGWTARVPDQQPRKANVNMGDDASIRFVQSGNLEERKAMLNGRAAAATRPAEVTAQPFELRHTNMAEKKQMFNDKVKGHNTKMSTNPFSNRFQPSTAPRPSRDDPNYGKPVAGSKSERRGKNAARHINAEVVFLCDMIYQEGERYEDGTAAITFGDLFQIYTRISNKVVGMLLRARKYGLLDFEGEILFQRRDDDVPILLLRPIQEIRDELHKDQEFEVGVCHKV